jgi:hypothetical protein
MMGKPTYVARRTSRSDDVAADLEVRGLLNFETATDGSAVRLIVEDVAGQRVGIVFTIETVTALLMKRSAFSRSPPTVSWSLLRSCYRKPTGGRWTRKAR